MSELGELVAALREQTDAINRLVQTNAALMEALVDAEEAEGEPMRYMDGSPVK